MYVNNVVSYAQITLFWKRCLKPMGQMEQNNSHKNDVFKQRGKLGTNNVVCKRCLKPMGKMEQNNSHKNDVCKQRGKLGTNNVVLETMFETNGANGAKQQPQK